MALVFLAALFTAIVWGCTDPDPEMADYPYELGRYEGLDSETEWKILKDYWALYNPKKSWFKESHVNDIYTSGYYGTHNGWIVVRITGLFPQPGVVMPLFIGGIEFPHYHQTMVWKSSRIYELPEAYDLGLLTQNDLRNIAGQMLGDG